MMLHPGILALFFSSLLISLMTIYAASYGIVILRRWNIASGSELQLALERRTYLISTIVCYFMGFQLISLFLFIQTADGICHLFVGAMCAVGTLTVNGFGYPALLLKTITFLLAGLWLILNHADNQGYDYPLIRQKYLLLVTMAPFILTETILQATYFLRLKPDMITSCCGSLFSQRAQGIASEVLATPSIPTKVVFYLSMAFACAAGAWFFRKGNGGYVVAGASMAGFLTGVVAILSFISLYIYEMPSHHCPFCMLQKEYGYIGYLIYVLLFLATITGVGVGVLQPYRNVPSLKDAVPALQRTLAAASAVSFLLFTLTVTYPILFTSFTLEGY